MISDAAFKRLDRGMKRLPLGQHNLSKLAKRFRVKRGEIESYVSETSGFDLLVGVRVGNAVGNLPQSDWRVEKYE